MQVEPLVSIIMPVYNAEKYLQSSINSVKHQTYQKWELIIIDNASTDCSPQILEGNKPHPQISVLHEPIKGVGHARNKGLASMSGEYFCFLDADDIMPKESIRARVSKFISDPTLSFVDGKVVYTDQDLTPRRKKYVPTCRGNVLMPLIRLSDCCFFGNSWMIKRDPERAYKFDTSMTHAEDLVFYISIAATGIYDYTHEEILHYRQHGPSAMSNLDGLEKGYQAFLKHVKDLYPNVALWPSRLKIIKVMVMSWLFVGKNPFRAVASIIRFING